MTTSIINYIREAIQVRVEREADPIDRTRFQMMMYFLFACIILTSVVMVAYIKAGVTIQFIRAAIFVSISTFLFILTWFRNSWKSTAHILVIMLTLTSFTNLAFYHQEMKVTTIQYVWIASALSFYILGSKWGWFYSTINSFTIISFVSFGMYNLPNPFKGPYPPGDGVYIFCVIYNFIVIISLHFFFFRKFYSNFQELIKKNKKIDELNKQLETTLEDVQNLSNERMTFLSTMSHELRTPLNGVIGISNALLHQNPRPDQKENLNILQFSANNLLSLINDILDFNKLNSEKLILDETPFDLYSLLVNCYENLQWIDREKNLTYQFSVDEEIKGKLFIGDATRLTQVLLNLLNNAVKYTEQGFVHLTVRIKENNNSEMTLSFCVEDSGIGIAPDKQESVFNLFYQIAGSQRRSYTGAGLGLAITKKILTLWKSEIHLTSAIDKGSKFSFELKMKLSEKVTVDSEENYDDIKTAKILVVDDHEINVLVIQKLLNKWGIEPCIAKTGFEAIQKIDDNDYDIVLMDLYMPGMDGFTATSVIRKMNHPKKSTIPIIALTAAVIDQEISSKIFHCGMNDILPKPFDPNILFAKILRYRNDLKPLPKSA